MSPWSKPATIVEPEASALEWAAPALVILVCWVLPALLYFLLPTPAEQPKPVTFSKPVMKTKVAGAGQLAGRLAVVTGASRGVGAAIAKVYAREGCLVVVNYFKSKDKAEALVAEIGKGSFAL